jgi:hypothetical protein
MSGESLRVPASLRGGGPPRRVVGEREMCPWAISKYFGD